jgi:HTH-type transcriptional regulator/antitoxin HigA
MDIKPIKNDRDYRRALKEIATLMDARPNSPDGDRLDVLATLVEAWEEKHYPIDPPDSVEAIRFAMEQRGLSRHDLEAHIGSRARVSEVLNRKRPLTLPMIRKLHVAFGIPADVVIRENTLRTAS